MKDQQHKDMKTEVRNNGITDYTVLIADEGKWLRRISSGEVMGEEIALGNSYYIGGELQDVPHLDVVSDFEEIDAPVEEERRRNETEY